jgi:hypothetical protein
MSLETPPEAVARGAEDWLRRLHVLTAFAASVSGGSTGGDRAALELVQHLSDELRAAGADLGFESKLARWLLSLRELLDSHLLTATAIAACDYDETATVAMLRRGIDAVAAGLPRLDDPHQ